MRSPGGVLLRGYFRGFRLWGRGFPADFVKFSGAHCLGPFKAVGGLIGCVQSRELGARAPCLPRFILLGSFSDTLLVVSILDIVCDCHL